MIPTGTFKFLNKLLSSCQKLEQMTLRPLGRPFLVALRIKCVVCNQPSNGKKHTSFMSWSQKLASQGFPTGSLPHNQWQNCSELKPEREIIRNTPAMPQPNHNDWYFQGCVNQASRRQTHGHTDSRMILPPEQETFIN